MGEAPREVGWFGLVLFLSYVHSPLTGLFVTKEEEAQNGIQGRRNIPLSLSVICGQWDHCYPEARIREALGKSDTPDSFFFPTFSSLSSPELSSYLLCYVFKSLILDSYPLFRYDIIPQSSIIDSLLFAPLKWFDLLPWLILKLMILTYTASIPFSFLGQTSRSFVLLWPSDC